MSLERSAGAVVFYEKNNKIEYLLLHYEAGHWDFPKGHIEKGEKIEETVLREIKEETGIFKEKLEFIEGFKSWFKYFFKSYEDPTKTIFKIVTFFLIKSKTKNVKISFEHIGYEWLTYEKALERITYKNAKEILIKANNYLMQK